MCKKNAHVVRLLNQRQKTLESTSNETVKFIQKIIPKINKKVLKFEKLQLKLHIRQTISELTGYIHRVIYILNDIVVKASQGTLSRFLLNSQDIGLIADTVGKNLYVNISMAKPKILISKKSMYTLVEIPVLDQEKIGKFFEVVPYPVYSRGSFMTPQTKIKYFIQNKKWESSNIKFYRVLKIYRK